MADNVAITAGTGTTIAADDIGAGLLVQRVKATWGPDGTANDTDVATGKPMPVQLRSPTGTDMTGAAGTASAAVQTIQGIASMTPVFVGSSTVPINTMNSVNANNGVNAAAAFLFDDSSPTSITENSFGFGRMSANHNQYVTIRDGAGNERGLNIDASGQLAVTNAAGTAVIGKVGINDGTNAITLVDAAVSASAWAIPVAIHPDSVNANGQATMANSAPVVLASNQTTLPVETDIKYVDVTLSLHTTAGVALDLLADAQIVAACTRANDVESLLQSIVVIDEDDNKAAIRLIFLSASTSLGTEGDAIAMSDSMLREVLGVVDIAAGDYFDFGGGSIVNKNGVGIVCKPASGTDDIYVAAQLTTGTPTYTASGIRLRLGFI